MNYTHSIPSSRIRTVKHYLANILVTTKDDKLWVTKEFSIGVNCIVGEFEQEPYNNAVGSKGSQNIDVPDPHANTE